MKKTKKQQVAKKKVSKPVKKSQSTRTSAPKTVLKGGKNTLGIMPLSDRIVVKALSIEESGTLTSFGIIIPDSSREKPEQGTVVAVGPGKRGEKGELIPLSVYVGDRVMFSKYGFDEIKVGGVDYLILPESSILAIIN